MRLWHGKDTHGRCDYMHKTKPAEVPAHLGRSSPDPMLTEEFLAMGAAGEGRVIFATSSCPTLQQRASQSCTTDSTNCTLVVGLFVGLFKDMEFG